MLRSVVIISCILLTTCLALTKPLTNQDVIEMVALGLSDDLIIDKIHATAATNFDTSIAGLKELKVNRVSESVIRAMINAGPGATSTKAVKVQSSDLGVPIEAGVYLVRDGKPTEVEPEIVNWQTGGVAKKTITLSIVKGDLNGKVARPRSALQVSTPLEFLIKTLEGTSVTEYQLLRLHEKGDRREFRSITGGGLHQSGGSERDEVSFDAKKVGAAVWRVRVEQLPMGEYGFLAPGPSTIISVSASGKMYTFGVTGENAEQNLWNRVQNGQNEILQPAQTEQIFDTATIGVFAEGNPSVRHDGVTLSRVAPDSPADRAGIKAGDVILALNDHYLFTIEELNREIRRHKPGTQVVVRYRRQSIINDAKLVVGVAD